MPQPDAIVMPEITTVDIRLDPVQSIIHSMVLMARSEELSGLNSWIYETVSSLTPEQKATHDLVMIGVHYAVLPTRLWKDFPTYLDHLENTDSTNLRDAVIDFYLDFEPSNVEGQKIEATKETLLEDFDFFLEYLLSKFCPEHVIPEIEKQAFELLNNPNEMKQVIVSHLRFLWEEYFKTEWERITPMLNDAVMAFGEMNFNNMRREEIIRYITGQDLDDEYWKHISEDINQYIFVPSAHVGPYLGKFQYKNALGLIFGARLPEDAKIHAPDLSINEITIRLGALADDVRLRILKLIAEEGELRSGDIIDRLGLSQSAASRHLKQLSATGYLNERRCSGAKCYTLNSGKVKDTMQAVSAFLLCE